MMRCQHDLQEEGALGERVRVHLDASDISKDLQKETPKHAYEVTPGLVANTEEYLGDQQDAEYDSKQNITAKRWEVVLIG